MNSNNLRTAFTKHRLGIEFILLLVILFLTWVFGRRVHIDIRAIEGSLSTFPLFLSGLIYIALYVVVTFFVFFSKDVFWISGAYLFGAFFSALFICFAEVINAFILFYLSRNLGRAYVESSLPDKYKRLDERLSKISFLWLFIFRAAPLIPYRFLDLAAGLTKINFRRYLAAVALGTPIKMFWIQYILAGLGRNALKPAAIQEYFQGNRTFMLLSLVYLVLIIAVVIKIRREGKSSCR